MTDHVLSVLHLPQASVTVEDADEEIFLLYTRKQTSSPSSEKPHAGLGFLDTRKEVVPVALTLVDRRVELVSDVKKRSKGEKKVKKPKEMEVSVELLQDLNALRNRKGDTGSVLWRVSLHLASYLLTAHHFPSATLPSLFPTLSTLRVLELGSGTGFLGLVVSPIVAHWQFSDQYTSLPLIQRNIERNFPQGASNTSVIELDWLHESTLHLRSPAPLVSPPLTATDWPDLIVAADCIYNPSISAPLAHTIQRQAGPKTMVLVASEMRDSEPLEKFLESWLDLGGWEVQRVVFDVSEQEGIGGKDFVVWVGWRLASVARG